MRARLGTGSAWAEISQLRQIDLHPGRIDLAHIEVLRDQAAPGAKVAQRLDLEIDLAARREVEGLRLAEIRRAGIDGKPVGAGRQIAIENRARLRRPIGAPLMYITGVRRLSLGSYWRRNHTRA